MDKGMNEIDVEEIMKNIREKIKKKKALGIYNEEESKKVFDADLKPIDYFTQSEGEVKNCLWTLSEIWDPRKDYPITSHRPVLGPFIIFTKQLIRKIFKLFKVNNIILSGQAEFNSQLVKLLNISLDNNQHLFKEISGNLDKIKIGLIELTDKLTETRQENILQKQRLSRILEKMETRYEVSTEGAIELINEKKNLANHSYLLFENKYRGKQEEIKKRLEIYLPMFKNSENILDIGCGRGEFLDLMQSEGIKAMGIDLNEDMVYMCREKNLDVKQIDAIAYLNSIEDNSLGGILASHVIEHLNPGLLIDFINLCNYKLKKQAKIVLETPNPLSIVVSAINFHLDPSHINPVHPETIKFLLENNGFNDIQIKYLSPFPDSMKLQSINYDSAGEASINLPIDLMNKNINKLNDLLYGYQDYAVIGEK